MILKNLIHGDIIGINSAFYIELHTSDKKKEKIYNPLRDTVDTLKEIVHKGMCVGMKDKYEVRDITFTIYKSDLATSVDDIRGVEQDIYSVTNIDIYYIDKNGERTFIDNYNSNVSSGIHMKFSATPIGKCSNTSSIMLTDMMAAPVSNVIKFDDKYLISFIPDLKNNKQISILVEIK